LAVWRSLVGGALVGAILGRPIACDREARDKAWVSIIACPRSPALLLLLTLACNTGPGASASASESDEAGASAASEPSGAPTSGSLTTDGEGSTAGATGGSTSETGVVADCSGEAPYVLLATSLGDMIVQLDALNAPVTTANFLAYVESGFYDGTIFHRVVKGFVIQGGGFTPDLMQKPTDPPIPLETNPALTHVDGAISMARTDDPNSATAQFYLCDGPQPFLDGQYAAFGVLVDGFPVRDAIADVAVGAENGFVEVPIEDVILEMAYCVAGI
jgi:cyclophilin family peptidyl-prolyl cis-trans isomerase